MVHNITVYPVGLAGGLCLFWNDDIQVCQYHSTSIYIETYIHDTVNDYKYWYIFVYLSTDKAIRRTQLQELLYKSNMWVSVWVMAGDFNDIIDNFENREEE